MSQPLSFVAWCLDDGVRMNSTSGGVFTALAEQILKRRGIVVGAAYDDRLNVRHEVVDSLEGLQRLRGVKYVHGSIGRDVYERVRHALVDGKLVLATGLPCQIAAFRKSFGSPQNLLLCDLVCFGAPSHQIWRKYVEWMEQKRGVRLKAINPRDKKRGWGRKTYYRYEWQDGSVTRKCSTYDPYAQAFYSALGFRRCCFSCAFRGVDRVSDITLGDFWGAQALNLPEGVLKRGVSCVLVHTTLGRRFFDAAAVERRQVNVDVVLAENFPIVRSAGMPKQWESYAADSQLMSFDALVTKYRLQVSRWQTCRRILRNSIARVVPKVVKRILRHG